MLHLNGFCLWDTLQRENMYHLIGLWVHTFIGTITHKLYISTLNVVNHGKYINYIFSALNRNIGLYYLVEVFVAIYLNLLSTILSLDKINESTRLFSYKYILLLVSFYFTALQKAQIIIANLIYGITVLVVTCCYFHCTIICQLLIFSLKIPYNGTLLPFLRNGFWFF